MSTHTIIAESSGEEGLTEALHDMAMGAKGPDAIIARILKDVLPLLLRTMETEKRRGTDLAELTLAIGHVAVSLHFSSLLTLFGSNAALAPVLPTLLEHVVERYAAGGVAIAKRASENRGTHTNYDEEE